MRVPAGQQGRNKRTDPSEIRGERVQTGGRTAGRWYSFERMDATQPTITGSPMSLRLANAYGVSRAPSVQRAATPTPLAAPASSGLAGLVAAKVPQTMDFEVPASVRRTETGSFAMYRHPADKNAAATGVELGRRLDMNA